MRRQMPVTVFAGDSASSALTGHSVSLRNAVELVIGRRSLSREHMPFVKWTRALLTVWCWPV